MVNKLLQRNSNVAKGQDVHIGLSNYAYEPSTSLVSINALPPKFSAAYKFGHFNRMQSQCFALLYESDENVVVCAPTASGKTVLMEIAIYRLFNSPESAATKRAVYLAPLKSLCAEKAAEWNANLRQAGLTCVDISGTDNIESVSVQQLCNASIICATPEKWISLTRKAPNRDVLSSLSLMLIDECHMVGSSRGAMLELAVLSTKRQNMQLRIIAVSATIKNLDDVAEWLSSGDISANGSLLKPAQTLVFGDEFRSTPLSKIVIGYESQYTYYRFQRNLDYKLPGIINAHCSTSTLGVGVNLPAGAIIVKGTKGYFESGYEEHSSTDILQFIGRAGRPQFGASGKAIILTEQAQVSFYRNLVSGQETLESSSNVGASLDSKKGSEAFTLIAYTSDDILLKYEVFNLSGTSAYYEVQIGLCNPRPNTLAILEVAPERYVLSKMILN
ncbi:ATP-dependent DNA helicase MER3 [Coemansia sp. RSA 990]|nr:ATP-dependent DNA helicase MER3 [Coemansia sp. RSA 990]